MYWADYPPPHFHAIVGEHEGTVNILTLSLEQGSLPSRALTLTLEWAAAHRDALLEDWDLCVQKKQPKPIPPLP